MLAVPFILPETIVHFWGDTLRLHSSRTLEIFNFIRGSLSFETRAEKYRAGKSSIILKYATSRELSPDWDSSDEVNLSSPPGFSSNGLSGMSKIFKQQRGFPQSFLERITQKSRNYWQSSRVKNNTVSRQVSRTISSILGNLHLGTNYVITLITVDWSAKMVLRMRRRMYTKCAGVIPNRSRFHEQNTIEKYSRRVKYFQYFATDSCSHSATSDTNGTE